MTTVDSQDPILLLRDLEDRHTSLLEGLSELEERVDLVLRQWGAARAGSERPRDLNADPVGPTG